MPAFRDIGADATALAAYKAQVRARFGASLEELANDRYAAYAQLERVGDLKSWVRALARDRYYAKQISAADMVLAADLFPVQLLDGITVPIDLLYYLERVQATCGLDLREGLLAS